ncbi:MAG: tetratricopeptide repeat protein [Thermodesulfobacteriota bacterium]
MPKDPSIYPQTLGVFSRAATASVGAGTTVAARESLTYWFVRRLGDDVWEVQPLNQNNVPSGERKKIKKSVFMENYLPEPRFYKSKTLPAMRTLRDKIAKGEEHYAEGNLDEAEKEFAKALMIDEKSIPANLGAGAVWCDKGEMQKVGRILDMLLGSDETFMLEQRSLFNRFGISLRKKGMFDYAAAYYAKALDLDPEDENLHFNLARVFFEKDDLEGSLAELSAALELNPRLEVAVKFLTFLKKRIKDQAGKGKDALGLDAAPMLEED